MKPVRSLALLLLACALVGMGFFLPWLGAAWQDAAMEQTRLPLCWTTTCPAT